jgi:glycosyltransferase involved in cell wall biosynthesis
MTEGAAYSLVDIPKDTKIFKAVNIDATAKQFVTEYDYNPITFSPMIRAQQRIYDAADLIVARNHWAMSSLQDDYGLSESKILMARNSLKCPMVSRADFPARQPGELVRFVFVGNDFARKGGKQLLRLHQEHFADRVELNIFSKQATPDRSLRNVVWHGFTPREKMINEMLPQMDVFIMPTFEDMHPWALIEAASIGLPIISTKMAGIPDIVLHGQTGLLCGKKAWDEVAEAMSLLTSDTEKRQNMGIRAREHINRNFDPDNQFGGLVQRLKMCL